MRVLMVNGSPRPNGSTAAAMRVVEKEIRNVGIDTEWFQIGTAPVHGCVECGRCRDVCRCVFDDDCCNGLIEAILDSDGVVIGSPVYFSGPNGALCAVLDRVFYAVCTYRQLFAGKPAAALVTRYRSGGSAAYERLQKYFLCSQMPIVSGTDYPAFGRVAKDGLEEYDEGVLRSIGRNMADAVLKNRVEK